jgi:hypothetical protein
MSTQEVSSESSIELAQRSPRTERRLSKQALIDNWIHDTQPGWSDYPSDSDESVPDSVVPCSQKEPFTPPFSKRILVPETPVRPPSAEEAEREEVMNYLKSKGFTAYTHPMDEAGRTMFLAFKIYPPPGNA